MFLEAKKDQIKFRGISKIVYDIQGNLETPILFIHGLGLDKQIFQNLRSILSSSYGCISLDLPGFGESDFLQDLEMNDCVEVIDNIISSLKISKVNIVGHSMGGYIGLKYASQFRSKVNSIILFHSNVNADLPERILSRKKIIQLIKDGGKEVFIDMLISNQFAEVNKKQFKEDISQLKESANKVSSEVLIKYQEMIMNRKGYKEFLLKSDMSVLFIVGEHDTFIPKKLIYEQAILSSRSCIELLKESAHIGMIEEPRKSAEVINSFLKNLI